MNQVILLRHGKTAGNRESRYIGRTNQPLCGIGRKEIEGAGSFAYAGPVYTSPLLRARQTAALLFPNARHIPAEGLAEMDFGEFEGKNFQELEHNPAYRQWVDGGCIEAPPGGESMKTLAARAGAAFAHILTQHAQEPQPQPLIIVAHGGSIMAILHQYAKVSTSLFNWHCPNGGGWAAHIAAPSTGGPPRLTSCSPILSPKEIPL